MKKGLLFLSLIMLGFSVQAQWSFTTTSTPYSDLSNPVLINNGSVWNAGSNFQVFLPFNFNLSGQTYSGLNVRAGGGLNFPGLGFRELFVFHTPFGGYMLTDRGTSSSLSEISYQTSGAVGQRIFKVQWKNAGFVQVHATSSPNDFINFQIWIFESDNHLEIHFGPNSASPGTYGYPTTQSNPNPGPSIKLIFDNCQTTMGLTGPANLPSYIFLNTCNPNYNFIDGTPANGITYNFFGTVTGISNLKENNIQIFPNPAQKVLQITNLPKNTSFKSLLISDLQGREVYRQNKLLLDNNNLYVPVDRMKAGVYLIKLEAENGEVMIRKIIKSGLE